MTRGNVASEMKQANSMRNWAHPPHVPAEEHRRRRPSKREAQKRANSLSVTNKNSDSSSDIDHGG